MAKLVIFDSSGRREVDLVEQNKMGRHPQNTIQVLDRVVSKEHCTIYCDNQKNYRIKDLGSLNGTFVNKKRISNEVPLRDGDEITLGNTRCMFLDQLAPDTAANMVDVSDKAMESHIHSKIASSVQDRFLPEKEILSDKVVRSDYEKLRVVYELQRDIGL